MRFIEKDFNDPPQDLLDLTDRYGQRISAHDKNLRTGCCKIIKPYLEKIYYGKCAYCETWSESEVDHYRPFKQYWWLVFEWSNLLLVCPTCNKKKGYRFPLKDENKRINAPVHADHCIDSKFLLEEEPLLLNPEIDDPLEHLIYLPHTSGKKEISLQAKSEKGKTTIEVMKLNRASLKFNYKRQVDKIINDIADFTVVVFKGGFETGEEKIQIETNELQLLYRLYGKIFRELEELQNPTTFTGMYGYTQLGYHMYEEFDHFILPHLPAKIRELVQDAFNLFKEAKLTDRPGIKEVEDFPIFMAKDRRKR